MEEQDFLDNLKKDGLILDDRIFDVMTFKGTNWKEMGLAKWFQFALANGSFPNPGVCFQEMAALHKACELLKGKAATILETGQQYGTSTRYFLIRNLKYGGDLTSIELVMQEKFHEAMKELGLNPYIKTIQGHSEKISWDKYLDILFIDSEHMFSNALGEYLKFRHWFKPGSLIGFHDSYRCYGVRRAVQVAREIDDLDLVAQVMDHHYTGIQIFQLKALNGAQVRLNKEFEEKRMAQWLKGNYNAFA